MDYLDNILVKMDSFYHFVLRLIYTKWKQKQKRKKMKNNEKYQIKSDNFHIFAQCDWALSKNWICVTHLSGNMVYLKHILKNKAYNSPLVEKLVQSKLNTY